MATRKKKPFKKPSSKKSGDKKHKSPVAKCPKEPCFKKGEADPNANMVASDNATRFIASWEAMGFVCPDGKVRAYQDHGCGKGNWTVGIGEFSGRNKDSTFDSEEEAYNSFVNKVKNEYSQLVRDALHKGCVKRQLSQREFDALVDLTYQHGNCQVLARKIGNGDTITEKDFLNQTNGFADRRSAEYKLYSGEVMTVGGYSRYLRLDNTNGGYCPIGKKPGWTKVNSSETYTLTY